VTGGRRLRAAALTAALTAVVAAVVVGAAVALPGVAWAGVEASGITGAANPLHAPLVPPGAVADTVVTGETLWYAVDVRPGQLVAVRAVVVGRPGAADDLEVVVGVADAQRQELGSRAAPFDGRRDVVVDLPPVEVPAVAPPAVDPPAVGGSGTGASADPPGALVTVTLRSAGDRPAAGTHRLQLEVDVTGAPDTHPAPGQAASGGSAPTSDQRTGAQAPPTDPVPTGPAYLRDLLPIAVLALAVGGVAGFELSRRGL
jgi:hypothetical protein